MTNLFQEALNAQQRREGIRENAARFAWANIVFETVGTGELLPSIVLEFPAPFFHKPTVSHGYELVRRPDTPYPPPESWEVFAQRAEDDPDYTLEEAHADYSSQFVYRLPRVSAGVYRWVRNSRGFYLGIYAYYNVQADYIDPDYTPSSDTPVALPVIRHEFTFGGQSYKAMSDEVNEAATDPEITPFEPPAF